METQETLGAVPQEEGVTTVQVLQPIIDPGTDEVLEQRIAIPYTTTIPSFIPRVNGVRRVYYDGADYWYYVYANGGWRSQKLGITQGLVLVGSPANGDMIYFNGTNWVPLSAGASGRVLQANGAAAPTWVTKTNKLEDFTHTDVAQVFSVPLGNLGVDVTIDSLSIGALGANDMLELRIKVTLPGITNADQWALKAGSTDIYRNSAFVASPNGTWDFVVYITNRNSTNAQGISILGRTESSSATTLVQGADTTSAVDLSSAFTLNLIYKTATPQTVTLNSWNARVYKP